MLTHNEKKILKFLFSSFADQSINHIAKSCNITPNGTLKILKKLEKEGILKRKEIGKLHSYYLDFNNEKTTAILNIALREEFIERVKYRFDDLSPLRDLTDAAIIFGSYLDIKKEPNDLDILFIIKPDKFKEYKKASLRVFQAIPTKVHDVLQTEEDLKNNLIKHDKVIFEILRTGIIFWGHEKLIEIVKNEYKR